ncbi:MAG: hypothetical protein A2X78_00620 [Gammaproteobacteria bacterium GWE2_37_16]|nr:MAG: hypothetical protein A2X78_00620 [Gammaproteobacteria bacterium GWE2_37_16]
MFWTKLIFIVTTAFMGWYLYNYIRHNPEAFSSANLNKSIFSLGVLALFLIAIVTVLVLLVRY